jgi:para-nitrobenzyl esterase
MNIWTPNPAPQNAPVIVWLHTGAFVAASANFGGSNGRKLAEETGVIVVAPNYRLGPLGFLAHTALEAEDPSRPSTGNYGLLDQRAALKWVRDNIAQFGGDPNNITLAGTSAGGQSVGLHMVMPGSWGLFQRAAIQSAYPTSAWSTRAEAVAQGDVFATRLGCTDPAQVLTCMRGALLSQVLSALPIAPQQIAEVPNTAYWEPIIDGLELRDQPRFLFEQGEFAYVPTIIGVVRDEGWGNFVRRTFPAGVTLAEYEQWVATEFGNDAASVLALYPAANFASPEEALARVLGDGQFTCEARRLADLIADGGLRGRGPHEEHDTGKRVKSPVFLFSYDYVIPDLSATHVVHGSESNIIFGNSYASVNLPPHTLTAADLALHVVLGGYWTRFAATGDPNDPAAPWPVYSKNHEAHTIFDTTITSAENLGGGVCEFWSGLFFRSFLTALPASQ